jgi:hypothetical protein
VEDARPHRHSADSLRPVMAPLNLSLRALCMPDFRDQLGSRTAARWVGFLAAVGPSPVSPFYSTAAAGAHRTQENVRASPTPPHRSGKLWHENILLPPAAPLLSAIHSGPKRHIADLGRLSARRSGCFGRGLAHLLPAKNQFSPKAGENTGEPVKIEGLACGTLTRRVTQKAHCFAALQHE